VVVQRASELVDGGRLRSIEEKSELELNERRMWF
jgi:hypothetical protein